MTVFLFAALALIAATLVFILPPLLRAREQDDGSRRDALNLSVLRDQLRELDADLERGLIARESYASARADLERRAAQDIGDRPAPAARAGGAGAGWLLSLAIPGGAVVLYMLLGSPQALVPSQGPAQEGAHEVGQQEIEAMVQGLARRLESQPDDEAGWLMLARSYNALGDYGKASQAYARLTKMVPDDAGLLADHADTLAMAQGQSLLGEPERLIARALAIEPANLKALALAGSAAFEHKDYARAIDVWSRLVASAPPDSDIAKSTVASMEQARQLQSGRAVPAPAAAAESGPVREITITGSVDIAPEVRAGLTGNETVFIVARAAAGPARPLAVLRKRVSDLPLQFVLDDSMSMTPDAKLSSAGEVVLSARISASGRVDGVDDALHGLSQPVKPGGDAASIVISRQDTTLSR